MADSSTEDKDSGDLVGQQGKTEAEAKVPVAALAKERADKREARSEADNLKKQLAEALERKDSDVQALIASLGPHIAEMVTNAAEAAVKPLKDEVALRKTAMTLGLNEEQAGELAKLKAETPGLTDARALAILQVENPTMFASGRAGQQITGISPSGDSPFRSQAPKEDFMAKIAEAVKGGDRKAAQEFSVKELFRRVNIARRDKHGGG